MLSDFFARLRLDDIEVDRDSRQRREIKTEGLIDSIRRRGVLNPIIVERLANGKARLIAGERRFACSRELGLPDIIVRFADELSNSELQIIELQENIKRSDLVWQDLVRSVAGIHGLYKAQDVDWTITETAEECNLSVSWVSTYLSVFEHLTDPNVSASGTVREAYNLLLRRKKRAEGDALQELLESGLEELPVEAKAEAEAIPEEFLEGEDMAPPASDDETEGLPLGEPIPPRPKASPLSSPPTQLPLPGFNLEPILNEDFLSWIETYDGKKFNLIHCDFPYGVNLFSSSGVRSGKSRSQMGRDEGESYDDSRDTYETLVEAFASNLNKIMSISAHIMFWLDGRPENIEWTRATFARLAPSVSWSRFPLIWLKSDNAGIAASPQYEPRHVYEVCLFGSRGKRNIVKIKSDAYSAPTDKSIHTSAKPEPMLRHFMEMLVDENTSLFDPTCGGGSALRAAESLGASRVLGLEKDPKMVEAALRALKNERLKRKISKDF